MGTVPDISKYLFLAFQVLDGLTPNPPGRAPAM